MAELQSKLILSMVDRVTAPARSIQGSIDRLNSQIKRTNAQIDAVRGSFIGAGAQLAAFGFALRSPIQAAMQMESAMADVRKVVDFPTPEGLGEFQEEIVGMSTRIPIAAEGLASIAAAAGQAGIAAGDLTRFTEQAAQVGVAFDISAEQAGDAMAKLMTGLDLNVGEVGLLADAMNHLSNAQASSASDILEVVRSVGTSGKQYGFTAEQVAAFGSAMVAAGARSDVAGTSFKNMGRALTRGASATARQSGAMKKLGLNSKSVAKRMQEDAVGTTIDVMERLAALPEHVRAAVSSDLFGNEADALGPLLTNLDLLRDSVGMVADESKYAGSAQAEFANRMETFGTRVQLLRNRFRALQITIGEALIPEVERLMNYIEPVIESFRQWARDNPQLIGTITKVTGALLSMRFAFLGLRLLGLTGKAGLLNALAFGMSTVGRAGAAMGGAVRQSIALQAALAGMSGQKAGLFTKIGAGMRGLAGVTGLTAVSAGMAAVTAAIAGISAPVWIAVAAAVAAVGAAWKYWDRISAIAAGFGQAIATLAGPWIESIQQRFPIAAAAVTRLGEAFGKIDGYIRTAANAVRSIAGGMFNREILTATEAAAITARVNALVLRIVAYIAGLPAKVVALAHHLYNAGLALVQSLWDGAKAKFAEFITWVQSIPGKIRDAIGNINLASLITGGTPSVSVPVTVQSGGTKYESDGYGGFKQAKATGGFMRAVPTLVGERGPEMIYPSRAGWVAHAQQVSRMADVSQRLPQAQQALQMADVSRRLPQARSMPSPARQSASARPVNVTFGSINIQGGTSASPRQLADEFGRQVRAQMRSHFSDEF